MACLFNIIMFAKVKCVALFKSQNNTRGLGYKHFGLFDYFSQPDVIMRFLLNQIYRSAFFQCLMIYWFDTDLYIYQFIY